jgi:hypothetical protein
MRYRLWIAVASTAIAGSMLACSDDFTPKVTDGGGDGAVPESGAVDALADAVDAAPVLQTAVRLAHWSPDAPSLDVCLAPHGTAFVGAPMMATLVGALDAGDGGSSGLSYTDVSAYIDVPVGQYDVRLVAAGASDCSAGIVSDLTDLPQFFFNSFYTLALIGEMAPDDGGPPLRAVVYADDTTSPPSTDPTEPYVGIRFINAAPDVPSADIGSYDKGASTSVYAAFISGVTFGATSGGVNEGDRNGYVGVEPMGVGYDIAVRASDDYAGYRQVVTTVLESVAGGAAVTVALVSTPAQSDAGGGADASLLADAAAGVVYAPVGSLVVCIDNAIAMLDDTTPSPFACCTVCGIGPAPCSFSCDGTP